MEFLALPYAARLQIYSELLVLPKPIRIEEHRSFEITYNGSGPGARPAGLFRSVVRATTQVPGKKLHPAILRVSKSVYSEASRILYSKNCFYFHSIRPILQPNAGSPVTVFLGAIGAQGNRIQHVSVRLLDFVIQGPFTAIPFLFSGIKTFELTIQSGQRDLIEDALAANKENLNSYASYLADFPSLREVTVNFEVYPGQELDAKLVEMVLNARWAVKLTTHED